MKESASVHHVVREAKAFRYRRLRQLTHIPAIDALRNDPVATPRRYRARTAVLLEVRVTNVEVLLNHQIQELLDELRIVDLIRCPFTLNRTHVGNLIPPRRSPRTPGPPASMTFMCGRRRSCSPRITKGRLERHGGGFVYDDEPRRRDIDRPVWKGGHEPTPQSPFHEGPALDAFRGEQAPRGR